MELKRAIGLTATPKSFIEGSKYDRDSGIYEEANYYYDLQEAN